MADDNVVTSKSIEDAEVEEPKKTAAPAEAKKAPAKKAASDKEILIKMDGPRGYAQVDMISPWNILSRHYQKTKLYV